MSERNVRDASNDGRIFAVHGGLPWHNGMPRVAQDGDAPVPRSLKGRDRDEGPPEEWVCWGETLVLRGCIECFHPTIY